MYKDNAIIAFNEALNGLTDFVTNRGIQHILLVTGKESFKLNGLDKFFKQALKNVTYHQINDFSVNPDTVDLKRCLEGLKLNSFDCIVAAGGGSVVRRGVRLSGLEDLHVLADEDVERGHVLRGGGGPPPGRGGHLLVAIGAVLLPLLRG